MKITVRHFGPIREANQIEVSPMSIFVGPSNSGKSYLAMLVYTIHTVLADDGYFRAMSYRSVRMNGLDDLQEITIDSIPDIFLIFAKAIGEAWKKKMAYCFGEEGRTLIIENAVQHTMIKVHGPSKHTFLDLCSPKISKITTKQVKEIYDQIRRNLLQSEENEVDNQHTHSPWRFEDRGPEMIQNLFLVFREKFLLLNQQEFYGDAYYLPAIRGGIMQSHLTLVSALIERAPLAGLSEIPPIPMFNGVLSDFMMNLIKISSFRFKSSRTRYRWRRIRMEERLMRKATMGEINAKMESILLSGQIETQESEEQYSGFRYSFSKGGEKFDLPLMNASSSVSELAPVSLFIKHYLMPYDLFILEEPEAHLHPAAQRAISELLIGLVNANVNVLITTHSDYILEQISNCIHADHANDDTRTRLAESKCKTYQFIPNRNNEWARVEKVSFNPETGIVTPDHLKVAGELYNETVDLMEQSNNVGD